MLIITQRIRRICEDMVRRIPELQHIDMTRIAIGYAQCKRRHLYGTQATTYTMPYEDEPGVQIIDGIRYSIPPFLYKGLPVEYLIRFYLPRLLSDSGWIGLRTILHELYHISPDFDGTFRLIDGSLHGASLGTYNRQMSRLLKSWLQYRENRGVRNNLYDFLYMETEAIIERYGEVYGEYYPTPFLTDIDKPVIIEPVMRRVNLYP